MSTTQEMIVKMSLKSFVVAFKVQHVTSELSKQWQYSFNEPLGKMGKFGFEPFCGPRVV